jgi:single-strand DNA-binding protein
VEKRDISNKKGEKKNMNNWCAVGRLVKDPELTETTSGKKFVNFTIAVPRKFNKGQADFIDCQVWSKSAEYLITYGKKGMEVEIEGASITTNINNDKKYVVALANSIQLKYDNSNNSNNNDNSNNDTAQEEDKPF